MNEGSRPSMMDPSMPSPRLPLSIGAPARALRTGRGSTFMMDPASLGLSPPSTPKSQPHSVLSAHDDATYCEVLEHDILEAQRHLNELRSHSDGLQSGNQSGQPPGRHYTERELQSLRESGLPGSAVSGKLALHEILSEKLIALERAALLASDRPAAGMPTPALSRLPSLLMLLEALREPRASVGSDPARGGAAPSRGAAEQPTATALAEAQRQCAALGAELASAELSRASASGSRADEAEARAREAESAREVAEALASAVVGEREEARESLTRVRAELAETVAELEACKLQLTTLAQLRGERDEALDEAASSRTALAKVRAELSRVQAGGEAAAGELSASEGEAMALAGKARADAEARAEMAEAEATSQLEAAAAARTRADALAAQIESMRQRTEQMEDLANRASELEALVGEEREGRAAAERRAESSERALEQRCCNDDESFEAVLVADLAAMRESYEAKLAAAHAAAREESAVHR